VKKCTKSAKIKAWNCGKSVGGVCGKCEKGVGKVWGPNPLLAGWTGSSACMGRVEVATWALG